MATGCVKGREIVIVRANRNYPFAAVGDDRTKLPSEMPTFASPTVHPTDALTLTLVFITLQNKMAAVTSNAMTAVGIVVPAK
jgi:hypothetical protein